MQSLMKVVREQDRLGRATEVDAPWVPDSRRMKEPLNVRLLDYGSGYPSGHVSICCEAVEQRQINVRWLVEYSVYPYVVHSTDDHPHPAHTLIESGD